jgi:hypothetical protein
VIIFDWFLFRDQRSAAVSRRRAQGCMRGRLRILREQNVGGCI